MQSETNTQLCNQYHEETSGMGDNQDKGDNDDKGDGKSAGGSYF